MGRRRALAIVLSVFMCAAAAEAARTDVVVFANGDRLTGEVKLLGRGQLQLKTDDAGTVTIEWAKLASIRTAGLYDLATYDGRRFVGRIEPAGPRQLAVVDASGAVTVTLPLLEVVSLAPIRTRFLQKIDGSVGLGGSYTQTSGVAQLSLDANAVYRDPSFAVSTNVSIVLTEETDAPDTGRYTFQFGYTRFRPNRWVVNSIALVERNTDLGIDLRATGTLALGRYLAQTNRVSLLVAAGGALGRELPVDAPAVTNFDALVALTASVFAYDFPRTNIDLAVLVFPGLSDPGRVRVNANARLKRELLKDFSFSVTGYDSFDNRPPSAEANRNDVGFSLALSYSF
jgi:hypothetical protein